MDNQRRSTGRVAVGAPVDENGACRSFRLPRVVQTLKIKVRSSCNNRPTMHALTFCVGRVHPLSTRMMAYKSGKRRCSKMCFLVRTKACRCRLEASRRLGPVCRSWETLQHLEQSRNPCHQSQFLCLQSSTRQRVRVLLLFPRSPPQHFDGWAKLVSLGSKTFCCAFE